MKERVFNNSDYNKRLQHNANSLRHDMTKSEACLWKHVLSAKQMKGYGFRRQRPVLNYIADFMCLNLKLIIEVDGITHDDDNSISNDAVRDKKLQDAGYSVLRFSAYEVLRHIDGVRMAIENEIETIEQHLNSYPLPPLAGQAPALRADYL